MRIRNVERPPPPSPASTTMSDGMRRHSPRRCLHLWVTIVAFISVTNAASSPAVPRASVTNVAASSVSDATSDNEDAYSLTPPPIASSSSTPSTPSSGNVVVQLAGYVKSSIVKTVDGCGQLWRNHGRCNDIRKKIQTHRDAVKLTWEGEEGGALSAAQKEKLKTMVGGISYEEYVFLQKGKEDRSKVFNVLFLMWGAPRFLPYALMFNPDMLPSPFRDRETGESVWLTQSRERSTAVVQGLLNLERDARVTPALAKLNVFGRKKQDEAKAQLLSAIDDLAHVLSSSLRPPAGAARLLEQLQPFLYRDDLDFTRAEKRLCNVPKSLVKAINGVLNGGAGGGLLAALQPHFMTRGRVVGHIAKITEGDGFLVTNNVNLTTIPKRMLQEACSERLMGVLGLSTDELRQQLGDWLTLSAPSEDAGTYYNENLARLVLMGYYSCWAAREDQTALRLAPLLYKTTLPPRAHVESKKHAALAPSMNSATSDAIVSEETLTSKMKMPLQRLMRR